MAENENLDAGWGTWPNVITMLRLAFLPVFFWVLFATDHRAVAAWLLAVLGATDWVDGFVARHFHQVSNVGKILDPTADRILVIGGLLGVAAAGGVAWWFALLTLARELVVTVLTLVLAVLGASRINVLWWGKVSTFALMVSFPLFLLTSNPHHQPLQAWQHDARIACWIIGALGLSLSWIVLAGYVGPARDALRAGRGARGIL